MKIMATGINALIILSAIYLVGTTTIPTTTIVPNVNKNDINEVINNYEETFTNIQTDLMKIKNNLDTNRSNVKAALMKFKNNLLNEDIFKKPEYNDQLCRSSGRQCLNPKCPEHILNKAKYNESFDVFSKLLFADFDEKLLKFEEQINNLLTDVLTSKMLVFVEFKLNKTNEEHLNDTEKWKEDIINSLEATKVKTFEMAKELIIEYKILKENKEKFERYIWEKFSEKKLKYICCLKGFDFDIDIDGLRCNPPQTIDERQPISLSQDDLRKFNLFQRNH